MILSLAPQPCTRFSQDGLIEVDIREHASLTAFNSFAVDARARWLAVVQSVPEVIALAREPRFRGAPRLVLGHGSNVLLTQDFPGLVIVNRIKNQQVLPHSQRTTAEFRFGGGESWQDLVTSSVTRGYFGLENLSMIPGTVGAAPFQNIGAYGAELSDCLVALEAVDLHDGSLHQLDHQGCQFGYRSSVFRDGPQRGRFLISQVSVLLDTCKSPNLEYPGVREALGDAPPTASNIAKAIDTIRSSKLPDPKFIKNAGSFFKNPLIDQATADNLQNQWPLMPQFPATEDWVKIPAAWLIEQLGWRGKRKGDVGCYAQHALVLVNHHRASGAQLWAYAEEIRTSVAEHFGIVLEVEPHVL